jgi:hypothetical protein
MRALITILVLITLIASACSSNSGAENDPVAQPAVADLSNRLGIGASSIAVISIDEVTWSDGSLGCPEPGMMYTQALEDGVLVVLEADGVRYEYHSGIGHDLFYCESPVPPVTRF